MLIKSKDPFRYPSISFQYSSGINHINDPLSSVKPYYQADLRIAKSWNNKFGIKATYSFLRANDWIAGNEQNFDRVGRSIKKGDRQSNPNYDGVNVYGDEISQNMKNVAQAVVSFGETSFIKEYKEANGGKVPSRDVINMFLKNNPQTAAFYAGLNLPGLLPDQSISRTGYKEENLADGNAQSFKTTGALYYNLSRNIQAVAEAIWGKGSTMYTGSDRYALTNFTVGQYKLELKGDRFYVRAYTTRERSGDSYVTSILASYLNETAKPSQQWFPEYVGNFIAARLTPGTNEAQAHAAARAAADDGWLRTGDSSFKVAKDKIRDNTISSGNGARFNDKSNLYHYEWFYDFSDLMSKTIGLQAGGSYRAYQLRSAGTIFDDADRSLNTGEFGAFIIADRGFLDNRLKMTLPGVMIKMRILKEDLLRD
ncbi:hypothetical protein [Mucilaginibacter defluvii]|uniref:TonB-dependent receptor-like beta-barrel domain-containing protein n=1 Tax=Mucilaginibacter defluvii TaxID=1196019 RepID=A0ABP9G1P3_9SPHI